MCIHLGRNAVLKYHKIQNLKDKHGKEEVGKKLRKGDQSEVCRNFHFFNLIYFCSMKTKPLAWPV